MKKGELKQNNKDYLNYKTVLTTMLCTLVAVLFMLCLVFVGMSIGKEKTVVTAASDIEVMPVSYDMRQYSYTLKDWESSADGDTAYMLSDLNTKYYGDNFAVLNSRSQYDDLVDDAIKLVNDGSFEGVEESIFESGSIVAVALEDANYVAYEVASVTRDEYYNIQVDVNAYKEAPVAEATCYTTNSEASPCETEDSNGIQSSLVLISIPNIQPKNVKVVISEVE